MNINSCRLICIFFRNIQRIQRDQNESMQIDYIMILRITPTLLIINSTLLKELIKISKEPNAIDYNYFIIIILNSYDALLTLGYILCTHDLISISFRLLNLDSFTAIILYNIFGLEINF